VCETYPQEVYVPSKMTPNAVKHCANFRAKRRFPALSFYYQNKGSSLWRSSQNEPGVMGKRSENDELMLFHIGQTNQFTSNIMIYDARSQLKAASNKFKGGGYENTDYYVNSSIVF
jgi:hypothetical protein